MLSTIITYGTNYIITKIIKYGVNEYIIKPVTKEITKQYFNFINPVRHFQK